MGLTCPYCREYAELLFDSTILYGRDLGVRWVCFPCDAYVGVHKGSRTYAPLGSLANAELREWRIKAHKVFDPIWRHCEAKRKISREKARSEGYKWLSESLNIKEKECHMGRLTLENCKRVVEFCEPFAERLLS